MSGMKRSDSLESEWPRGLSTRDLTDLANKFGTDKGTVSGGGHAYTIVYELLLRPLRDRQINLLEIGLAAGGPEVDRAADRAVVDPPSIRMWHEYFPRARIHGLDISDFSEFESDWFVFFRADCGDAKQLEKIARETTRFDIIVDDGSHASFHQQLTLCTLFPTLKPGGLYIIEDLTWQPETYEATLPPTPKTADLLVEFVATGRFRASAGISADQWRSVERDAANVVLFDEDQLMAMRRLHNAVTGHKPEMPHYLDASWPRRVLSRGYARRLLEGFSGLARAAMADASLRRPRIKLAVLQKL
jgi:hypothetical protein